MLCFGCVQATQLVGWTDCTHGLVDRVQYKVLEYLFSPIVCSRHTGSITVSFAISSLIPTHSPSCLRPVSPNLVMVSVRSHGRCMESASRFYRYCLYQAPFGCPVFKCGSTRQYEAGGHELGGRVRAPPATLYRSYHERDVFDCTTTSRWSVCGSPCKFRIAQAEFRAGTRNNSLR